MRVAVAGQVAQVAQRLVAGVEQPQLHQLVGLDVVDDLHADPLQRRPPGGEAVLEHPLGERLTHHRPPVVDAEPVREHGPVRVGGHRGDPVHHRVRERDVLLDPVGQLRVPQPGERADHRVRHRAVALDVVAGHDRERLDPGGAAAGQRLDHIRVFHALVVARVTVAAVIS